MRCFERSPIPVRRRAENERFSEKHGRHSETGVRRVFRKPGGICVHRYFSPFERIFHLFPQHFYEMGQADLRAFFEWHPWIFLFLIPAVAMRLWAEERRTGTIELILTLPVTLPQVILGKFLAAWLFIGVALLLTFPMVLTVGYLGDPDLGAIFCAYCGSFLMAGAYLSVGNMTSALTRNQVISFILSVVICLFLVLAGWPPITDVLSGWAPPGWWTWYPVSASCPIFLPWSGGSSICGICATIFP